MAEKQPIADLEPPVISIVVNIDHRGSNQSRTSPVPHYPILQTSAAYQHLPRESHPTLALQSSGHDLIGSPYHVVRARILRTHGPRHVSFLYTRTKSSCSSLEPAAAKTRKRKGQFAEGELIPG